MIKPILNARPQTIASTPDNSTDAAYNSSQEPSARTKRAVQTITKELSEGNRNHQNKLAMRRALNDLQQ